MRRNAPFVVDIRRIRPMRTVKDYQGNLAYHGGGPSYRGYSQMGINRSAPRNAKELPPWVRKEVLRYRGKVLANERILKDLSKKRAEEDARSGARLRRKMNIQNKEVARLKKEYARSEAELEQAEHDLRKKLNEGKFESEYGNLSDKDLFNAAIQSFAEGPLSSSLADMKTAALTDPKAREQLRFNRVIANRKVRISEVMGKPLTQITEAEARKKVGRGIYENDLLIIKAINGELTVADVERAKNQGIINEKEESFFKSIDLHGAENPSRVVYTSQGVSRFSTQPILVEAKITDHQQEGSFPIFGGLIPEESIRTIYTHSDEVGSQKFKDLNIYSDAKKIEATQKKQIDELKRRVNTFNAARELAEHYEKQLIAPGANPRALAKQLKKNPYLMMLASRIAKRDPSLMLETYKSRIPHEEI